jgi:hypothetical protein
MRRSTVVAVLGGATAVASGAWVLLVERDIVTDKHIAGVALARAAIGAFAVGLALCVGGLLVTRRRRAAEAAEDDDYEDEGEQVWPTIVVRRHGRPRQRPMARIVTVAPSTWPVPSPHHPSMTGVDPATGPFAAPTGDDSWLADNVQPLPFRS